MKKVIFILLSVFICSTFVLNQNYQLTNEQKIWISKANRHEKNGWICLHIEGSSKERGFQYGYLLSKEIKDSIGINSTEPLKESCSSFIIFRPYFEVVKKGRMLKKIINYKSRYDVFFIEV